jgi:hypothetical protein
MRIALCAIAALISMGCTKQPAYVYGRDLSKVQFHAFSANMGIYPDQSILDDPNNPFATDPPTYDPVHHGIWDLEASAGPVPSFYGWATLNALGPGGEAQYYTAVSLKQIFQTGQAAESEMPAVRSLGVRAFQAVLDYFPTAVTYDASGKIASELVTPSYQGIVALGGTVQGGWVLVKGEDGGDHAVKQQ